jgi:hypothetical protein
VNERPPNEDDEVDEQYRRASARDASRPGDSVRHAILRRAAELAVQRAAPGGPVQSAPDQDALGARRGAELSPVKLDFKQPGANEARWWPAAYGGLAAAALAGLLIAPHFLPPSPAPASLTHQAVLSASKKTEAPPATAIEGPQAPAAEASPAPLSTSSAQRVPGPAMPVPAMPAPPMAATPMRARTPLPYTALAPRADVPAGTSSVSSAASDTAAAGAARDNAAVGAATATPQGSVDKAAPALAAKPRAFAGEASPNEPQGLMGGLPRSAAPPPSAGLQSVPAAPPAQVIGSGAVSALAAARARAPTDSATALRQAAQSGDTSRLRALLDEQIDVDARDPAGRTALMLAVIGGQAQAVDALLARGADPNAADSRGTTPLAAALAANHADIIAALRRAGAH